MRKLKKEVKSFLMKGLLFVGVAVGGAFILGSTLVSEKDIEMKEVVVHHGDTLWEIVSRENPHYKGDVRNLLDYVEADPSITPGQVVEIPIYKK